MSKTFTIHHAKTHLSRLIEIACSGEEVIIARGKTPVAKLSPIRAETPARRFGSMKGRARVSAAFFQPLPAEDLESWEK